jgi:U3 small nucleolar RNA-associated protein 10
MYFEWTQAFLCSCRSAIFSLYLELELLRVTMTSSLARQLQTIRSETVATLDKRKHEKVASLLFDPNEAAGHDLNALRSLGLNGLHGLIQIDSRFHKFGDTLFSETAKDIDRAVQVANVRSS